MKLCSSIQRGGLEDQHDFLRCPMSAPPHRDEMVFAVFSQSGKIGNVSERLVRLEQSVHPEGCL